MTNFPINDEHCEAFLKEYAEGKYPLTDEDKAALARSRPELLRRIRKIIYGPKPDSDR